MGGIPGSARLVLVEGVVHLNEPQAVFEAMLKGWERQQRSRLLGEATITQRERLVRRFAEFAEGFPWEWNASDVEDFTDPSLGLIKRKILARTNDVLGKPLIEEVVFSDFSFIEE